MPGIVMNVGSNAIKASGASSSGGGQTLGNAQGNITINVNNVTQANSILQNSAKQIQQAFSNMGAAAKAASQQQIAAARTSAAQAQSAAKINIANSAAQAKATQSAAQQVIAGHNVQTSAIKVNTAQQTAAYTASTQQIKIQALQQQTAYKQASNAATAGFQAQYRATQSQIQQNRLVVSSLAAQAAQARATARAQQQAAQQSQSAWQKFHGQINEVRSELLLLSAGAGLLVGAGVGYAASLEEAKIQLEGLTGTEEEANKLMDSLQQKGRQTGSSFKDMLSFAVQLLPTLQGETKELDRWYDIVRRTATLNRGPAGGVQGATFSLREAFLSIQQGGRDFVSIADRFNISKIALANAFDEALGQTNEEKFINAMDNVLNSMGATTEAADKMGQTFNASLTVAKDAALQLAAQGFGPLIAVLGPGLQVLTDWMGILRETAPEVSLVASGFLTLVTVGTPLLLLVNQLTLAWTAMGLAAQTALLRAGRIGTLVGAAAIGVSVGRGIGNRIGDFVRQSKGQEPLSEEQKSSNLSNFLFDRYLEIVKAGNDIYRALVSVQVSILNGVALLQRGIQEIYKDLADSINIPFVRDKFLENSKNAGESAFSAENEAARLTAEANAATAKMYNDLITQAQRWGIQGYDTPMGASGSKTISGFTVEQEKIMVETYQRLNDIARNEGRALVDETEQWESQRAKTISNYNKEVAREERDFLRQRANSERRFQQSLVDAANDSALQRQRWQEDFDRSLAQRQEELGEQEAESREDSAKRIAEIEEDYAKEREEALLDHRDRILKAASNLDAEAIREEEMRFARESQKAKERLDESISDEKESLNERLKDGRESFQEFEEQQRESLNLRFKQQQEDDDRQRAQQIRDFEEAKKQEDIERSIRNSDRAVDHQEQLTEMDTEHLKRLEQIKTHAQEERDQAWIDHNAKLAEVGLMTAAWQKEQENLVNNAILAHRRFWNEVPKALPSLLGSAGIPFQMNPDTGYRPIPSAGASAGNQIQIGSVVLQVLGSTNMGPEQIYAITKRAIHDVVAEVAQ